MKAGASIVGLLLGVGALMSCAGSSRESQQEFFHYRLHAGSLTAEKVPYRRLDPLTAEGLALHEVTVRLKTEAEVSRVWPDGFWSGLGQGGGLAVFGIGVTLLNPFAQGAAIGGILLTPMLATMGYLNSQQRAVLTKALVEANFPQRVGDSLHSRLVGSQPGAGGGPRLEVLILGYGLFSDVPGSPSLCWTADAEVRVVTAEDQAIFRDDLFWGPYRRSEDVPPPQCASLQEFAAEDGKLARRTFSEAGEILGAVIARRLRGKP